MHYFLANLEISSSVFWLLVTYATAIVLASVFGGLLPSMIRLTHMRKQMIISCVGGMMLGVAVLHLLPHAVIDSEPGQIHATFNWVMLGMLVMFFLLRAFHVHQHGPEELKVGSEDEFKDDPNLDKPGGKSDEPNSIDCRGADCELAELCRTRQQKSDKEVPLGSEERNPEERSFKELEESERSCGSLQNSGLQQSDLRASRPRFIGMLCGLGLHTLLDGVAVAAAVGAEASRVRDGGFVLLGFGVFLAILFHKPLDAISITSLMRLEGKSANARLLVNLGFALMAPFGMLLTLAGLMSLDTIGHGFVAGVMAFSAGVFLCIALSDLLPEMQFHSHNRIQLTAALLVGVYIAWFASSLEPEHMHDSPINGHSGHIESGHHHSGHDHGGH